MNGGFQIAPPFRLVNGRHGCMLVNPHDQYVGRAVLHYGEYGEIEFQILRQLMTRPGAIVEVGANIGTHTIPLARLAAEQKRKVFAFEPQPVIFQNMCANLALNGIGNVTALPFACGARREILHFPPQDYFAEGNFGGVSMGRGGEGVAVTCVTLDEILAGQPVSLMKLDVEGMELEVFKGAEKTIAASRPYLYAENDRQEKSRALIEWLWAREYRVWWHTPPLFNLHNFFSVSDNIYPNLASCNILALPREHQMAVANLREVTDPDWHPFPAPRDPIFEDDDA